MSCPIDCSVGNKANDSRLGSSMEKDFMLWDDLLIHLSFDQPRFVRTLTDEMSLRIVQPSQLDITIDAYREAIYGWLDRILTTEEWAEARRLSDLNASCVISTCLMNPNYWSRRLTAALVIDTNDQGIKAQWGDLVQASNAQYAYSGSHPSDQEQASNVRDQLHQVNAELAKLEQQAYPASRSRGWEKWQGPWVPKPIGMI